MVVVAATVTDLIVAREKSRERDVQVLRLHRRLRDHRGVSTAKDSYLFARYRSGIVQERRGGAEKPEEPSQKA